MKHKVIWQLVVPLLGLCVLFMLLATEPAKVQARQEPVEISVILRETENGTWSATRQGMEQAAMDLNVELRVLTLSRETTPKSSGTWLEREVASGADGVLLIPADRRGALRGRGDGGKHRARSDHGDRYVPGRRFRLYQRRQ